MKPNVLIGLMGAILTLSGQTSPTFSHGADAAPGTSPLRVALEGTLSTEWGDPPRESGLEAQQRYLLFGPDGKVSELLVAEETLRAAGGFLRLNGQSVRISGEALDPVATKVAVERLELVEKDGFLGGPERSLAGAQPWITVLCRFSDSTGTTPETVSWVDTLMGATYPGLDHFWRELSYNTINLTGSDVVGWYDLPRARAYYVYDSDGDGDVEADLGRLCTDATAVANADVNFTNFVGINLMFNQNLDCCAWGGSCSITLDGQNQAWPMTWMPPWGYRNQDVLGQEMGHGFGLPHSSGPYSATYDSQWDVMSGGGVCGAPHIDYGCIGVHTVTYHKELLGWIPSGRLLDDLDWMAEWVTLERLASPPVGNYLMARLYTFFDPPFPSQFYTVECRRRQGYDDEVPGEGVVIHHVDEGRTDRLAQVVDPDGDGDPNDAGAVWTPGEYLYDAANSILVFIEEETSTGMLVSLTNSPHDPTYVDRSNPAAENGTSTYPWLTFKEGAAGVVPGGTVMIAPGTYPEGSTGPAVLTVRKPMTIQRDGTTGTVSIGG